MEIAVPAALLAILAGASLPRSAPWAAAALPLVSVYACPMQTSAHARGVAWQPAVGQVAAVFVAAPAARA